MRRAILVTMAVVALWMTSFAQDPGNQDSIIVGQISFNPENSHVMVPIYAVTDDSVAFYNIPLGWFPRDLGVHPGSRAMYFYPLTTWDDVFDSVMLDEGYIRNLGWYDIYIDTLISNIPLCTNGERWHIMTVFFVVPDEWNWQNVRIDTVTDERGGPIAFGLIGGMIEFAPAFQYGGLFPQTGIDENDAVPRGYSLAQNYPNPFNPSTTIEYKLPEPSDVSIEVYDINGRIIAKLIDERQDAGSYRVTWNAQNCPTGIYFYKIQAQKFSQVKRCLLIK